MQHPKKSPLKHWFRRGRIKWKLQIDRSLHTGANRRAVASLGQLLHKILGTGRNALQCMVHLIVLAGVVLGELVRALLGKPAVHLAGHFRRFGQFLADQRAAYLLRGRRKSRSRITACAFLATATITLFSISYFGIGVEVFVNGQSLGFVETKQQMEELIATVEQRTSGYLGRPYNLSMDISYSLGYAQHDNRLDPVAAEEFLFSQVTEVSTQYVLSVDGVPVGANPSKTALELLKQRLLSSQVNAGENARAEFVQELTIEQMTVPSTYVSSVQEIEQTLENGRTTTYSVQQGDTLSTIAESNGMTLQQVQGLNPHIDPTRIHVGEEITLGNSRPLLSVKKTSTIEYTQAIAYAQEVEYSDEMYKNQSKIAQAGQNGQAAVVANVVSIDGVEQDRVIQSWEIVSQPQNEIKLVGTKEPPAKAAKGYFIQPFRGLLTSNYGYRSRGYHTGVDWAGTKGSPVVASDGGTVILAGWNGGYGNCVIIDHGNGLQTLYAHNSALAVKVGQKVAQGEQIAKLGSTGNSTGNHCHWEVRVNGKTVNPMPYLKR